jgi:hypothetical protein
MPFLQEIRPSFATESPEFSKTLPNLRKFVRFSLHLTRMCAQHGGSSMVAKKISSKVAPKSSKNAAKKPADAKKVAPKSKASSAKAAPAPKAAPKAAKRRVKVVALSEDERASLLRPPPTYQETVERVVSVWQSHRGALRVANRSAASLRSMLNKARRDSAREEKLRAAFELKMAPLRDARMRAEHAMWETTLDVYAVAKAQSRTAPELERAFAFLAEEFSRAPAKKTGETK